ncbi:MAG: MFS transporter [Heliobacteriaceae bacterium]|nr:MFS transporter [Heliobacteriaceae bacterium]
MSTREIKWTIFAVTVIGNFIAMLDSTTVNLALYPISQGLNVAITEVQWIVIAYMAVVTVLLPVFGKLGDVMPKNKLYMYGYLIFAAGAFLNTISPNLAYLIAFRCIEAVGASIMISNSAAIIATIFKDKKRGKALGINGGAIALGGMLGPSLGGVMIGFFGWHAIFFPCIPIALAGAFFAYKLLPSYVSSSKETRVRFEVFKVPAFVLGNLAIITSYMAMFTNGILIPFYLQEIMGFSALLTGLLILPFSITLTFTAPLSGNFAGKHGSRLITMIGPLIMIIALSMIVTFDAETPVYMILIASAIMGIGNGLFQSPSNTAIIASVTKKELGFASGILALSRNMGNILGVAATISIFHHLRSYFLADGMVYNDAFLRAYHLTAGVGIGFAVICFLLSNFAYKDK